MFTRKQREIRIVGNEWRVGWGGEGNSSPLRDRKVALLFLESLRNTWRDATVLSNAMCRRPRRISSRPPLRFPEETAPAVSGFPVAETRRRSATRDFFLARILPAVPVSPRGTPVNVLLGERKCINSHRWTLTCAREIHSRL